MNQWCNTESVIEWFKAIKNKGQSSFIKFVIAYTKKYLQSDWLEGVQY